MTVSTKKIVPLGWQADYLSARRIVAERGMKLPSNVLHDDYLVRTGRWEGVKEIYPAWASEILVHPEKGGKFKKGKDVVDSETGWIVPAKYIPKEVMGKKRVGLLLVPGDIEENGKVVIHPAGEPVILVPFIQKNGECGKVDNATRVPISKELFEQLPHHEKRWLYRKTGVGVRPLARFLGTYDGYVNGRYVICLNHPDYRFGVAGEASVLLDTPASTKLMVKEESGKIIVEGTPEQLSAAVRLLEQLKQ